MSSFLCSVYLLTELCDYPTTSFVVENTWWYSIVVPIRTGVDLKTVDDKRSDLGGVEERVDTKDQD